MANKKTNKHRCPAKLFMSTGLSGNEMEEMKCELLKGHDIKEGHETEGIKWRID